jgi:hypothetical protein
VYGVEAGYAVLMLDHFALRPGLGIGRQTTSSSSVTPGAPTFQATQSFLYLEPGLTALLLFGRFLVGADANAYLLPYVPRSAPEGGTTSSFATGFTVHAQVGMRFSIGD